MPVGEVSQFSEISLIIYEVGIAFLILYSILRQAR
jgi:hypothetical protein